MTTDIRPPTTAVPTAAGQAPLPPEQVLHSANCGLIIHRVGQLQYEFAAEGRQFGHDVLAYLTPPRPGRSPPSSSRKCSAPATGSTGTST